LILLMDAVTDATLMAATKALPDTKKIEPFGGNFFKWWHDRIYDTLHAMNLDEFLTEPPPDSDSENYEVLLQNWIKANRNMLEPKSMSLLIFLDFKMTEDKEVTSQIHGFHMLINDLKNENIIVPESFVVGRLIEKLPNSWKDYKKNNKHERKHKNLEDAIVHIRTEEKHRQMDQLEEAKEITFKANIAENEAHP
ncbi:hypothetical protein CISIN_1g041870mg, partial [Citrus sinensis]